MDRIGLYIVLVLCGDSQFFHDPSGVDVTISDYLPLSPIALISPGRASFAHVPSLSQNSMAWIGPSGIWCPFGRILIVFALDVTT